MFLATTYPLWFVALAWATIVMPVYPGVLLMMIGGRMIRLHDPLGKPLLSAGVGLLIAGTIIIVLGWDSATGGNPYGMFGEETSFASQLLLAIGISVLSALFASAWGQCVAYLTLGAWPSFARLLLATYVGFTLNAIVSVLARQIIGGSLALVVIYCAILIGGIGYLHSRLLRASDGTVIPFRRCMIIAAIQCMPFFGLSALAVVRSLS